MSKFLNAVMKQSKPLKNDALNWEPLGYQMKTLDFLLNLAGAGALLDPGLGKTSIFLAVITVLKKKKMVEKTLIIAPKRVCYLVWPKEIKKWKDFNHLTYTILHGKDKDKNLEKDVDIYLINPEGLPWLTKKNFKKLGFSILGVDESTKFKSTNTIRFKLIKSILPFFDRRYIMTGTPAPKGLGDLFGQIYIVDEGRSLGRYISHFRNKYFYRSGFGGYDWKLQEGAEERIQEAIKPVTIHLSAEDHLDLPKLITNRVEIELESEARRYYDEMEKELFTLIGKEGEVAAASAAVATMKCRQIANGGVYDENGNTIFIHDQKSEATFDLVEEIGGTPTLIAYEFKHDLERLFKAFGKNTPFIGGGVNERTTLEIEEKWNAGKIPVLFGNPASMAHGLNFQNAGNHIIWHSLTYNYEYYYQFIRRILRQGSKHKNVFNHLIIATDTVDEAMFFSLIHKHNTQKNLLEGLKAYLSKKHYKNKTFSLPSLTRHDMVESEVGSKPDNIKQSKQGEYKMAVPKPSKFAKKTVTVDTDKKKVVDGAEPVAKRATSAAKEATAKKQDKADLRLQVGKPSKIKNDAEPRSNSFSDKKIKVLNKTHTAREGTVRAAMFDALLSSKTVEEARQKEPKIDGGVIRIAQDQGLIELA